jgi:cytochrome c peroxidase
MVLCAAGSAGRDRGGLRASARLVAVGRRVAILSLTATGLGGCALMDGNPWGWHRLVYNMPPRPPARPILSPAEYVARAADLRAAYARAAAQWPAPTIEPGIAWAELAPLPRAGDVDHNPLSPAKAELGRALFFDPRLSGSGRVSCASCHDPAKGWADDRRASVGHAGKRLRRNTPAVLNAGHMAALFWDGRAGSLEEQAVDVLTNPDEMGSDDSTLRHRLQADPGYPRRFAAVFGDPGVTLGRVAAALACFERTIVAGRSRFDRFLAGESDALTDAEIRGLHLFRTEGRCLNCHHGPTFSDDEYHAVGLSRPARTFSEDLGRYGVTKDPADAGKFRTPSLRNVGRTAPYMHSGLYSLDTVLKLYNDGMPGRHPPAGTGDRGSPVKSHLLRPLGLNRRDLSDLAAFLRALDEPADVAGLRDPVSTSQRPKRSYR